MTFENDYRLSPTESARIKCQQCGEPATKGQNNGSGPFWYHCDACAEHCRQTGHFYGAGESHCLNCDKPATSFCLSHHDIGGEESLPPEIVQSKIEALASVRRNAHIWQNTEDKCKHIPHNEASLQTVCESCGVELFYSPSDDSFKAESLEAAI